MLLNAGVFNNLTCKCASRHSGVQFWDIKPPKSGPYPSVFPHFDLQICFAPQRRAIFEHRNFQNGSGNVVFCAFWLDKCAFRHSRVAFWNIATSKMAPPIVVFSTFWLANVLFATAAWQFWNIGTSKMAPGHPQCFVTFWLANVLFATAACHFSPVRSTATSAPAALASLLFEHQEPRFIEKTQRFATSLTFFAHVELLASDSTRMLIFLLVTWLMLIFLLVTWLLCDSAFQLYILSEVRLLNFLRSNSIKIFKCIQYSITVSYKIREHYIIYIIYINTTIQHHSISMDISRSKKTFRFHQFQSAPPDQKRSPSRNLLSPSAFRLSTVIWSIFPHLQLWMIALHAAKCIKIHLWDLCW